MDPATASNTHSDVEAAPVAGLSMMPEGIAEMPTTSDHTADGPALPMVGMSLSPEEMAEVVAAREMADDDTEDTTTSDTDSDADAEAAPVARLLMMPEEKAEMPRASDHTADGPAPPMVGLSLSPEETVEMVAKEPSRPEHEDTPLPERPSKPCTTDPLNEIIRKVDSYPMGYPSLAAWMASDPNFPSYRQYQYLCHRCLLRIQAQLAVLESRLERFDAIDEKRNRKKLMSQMLDEFPNGPRRQQLLEEIESKLREYDELLFRTKELIATRKPAEHNRKSCYHFIRNKQHLLGGENRFIDHIEDLVTLSGDQENGNLNFIAANLVTLLPRRAWQVRLPHLIPDLLPKVQAGDADVFQYLFQTKVQSYLNEKNFTAYLDKNKLDTIVRAFGTILGVVLLLLPILAGPYIEKTHLTRDMVVLASTCAFALASGIFTRTRPFEILIASAVYCALLTLFLGNTALPFGTMGAESRHGGLQKIFMRG
ncbi:hypothetical protein MMC30_003048 [Trapelia coarctata]|nr:hypothetical protein [Trapelia coarctata]